MKSMKLDFIIFGIVLVCGIVIGGIVGNQFLFKEECKTHDGLWIGNANMTTAKELAHERDYYGDWVCVNIRGMKYERAIEVCNHEVGHEIFAEICEKDIDKCFEVINQLEEKNE